MNKHLNAASRPPNETIIWRKRNAKPVRFQTLLILAHEGNEEAIGDLWNEFGFDYQQEGGRHDLD